MSNPTVAVPFSGTVSAQVGAGENVTVTVTDSAGNIQTLTAQTDVNGNYAVTGEVISGAAQAVASIAADSEYAAATSPTDNFTIPPALQPRTITISTPYGAARRKANVRR